MAVWVYKEGKKELIDPLTLDQHLSAGWRVSESVSPTMEQADTNNTGKLSSKEVRAAAEKAGIEGHEIKRIAKLKAELGYE